MVAPRHAHTVPIRQQTEALIKRFDIRAQGPDVGREEPFGRQIQKVVLAREFSDDAGFLLVDQPTRGVDIGATEAIHAEIMRQRAEGRAILLDLRAARRTDRAG